MFGVWWGLGNFCDIIKRKCVFFLRLREGEFRRRFGFRVKFYSDCSFRIESWIF